MHRSVNRVCVTAALLVAPGIVLAAQSGRAVDLRGENGGGPAVIYGEIDAAVAERLAAAVAQVLGRDVPAVRDRDVLAPDSWNLAVDWVQRPLILLGSVNDNEVMFALYTRYLCGVTPGYPGAGRFVIRTLFSPFVRGADMVIVGAADPDGLSAGVSRFGVLVREAAGSGLGPTIEIGDAEGPARVNVGGGNDFARLAHRYYWTGDTDAGQQAVALLEKELATRTRGLWGFDTAGHYQWERLYRPLRQLQAAGLLPPELSRRVDLRLVENLLENTDWALVGCLNSAPGTLPAKVSRHQISALAGALVIADYLHHAGTVPEERRDRVRETAGLLRSHAQSYVDGKHFCSRITGTEGAETLNIMVDMFMGLGDRQVVTNGTLQQMAEFYLSAKDNLGWHACDDSYIGCRPGCHYARSSGGATWLYAGQRLNDGVYRWLLENMHAFLTHFQVARPPETVSLLGHLPAERPDRFLGVSVQPLPPAWYELCRGRAADEAAVPIDVPYERTFARAAFRDGFSPDDAYLLMQGVDRGSINSNYAYQANALTRVTELGSLLLYSNSLRHSGWSQNVVSVSRGALDPQSTACELVAVMDTPVAAGLRSVHEKHGGMRWTRAVLRRRQGYTLVIDRLAALETDTYGLTCRWRSFHPGQTTAGDAFEAVDGQRQVRFRIACADPVTWQARTEKRDGAARPTVVRQVRRARLQAGETVTFRNLLVASDAGHPRTLEVRPLGAAAMLVRGRTESGDEVAAAGLDTADIGLLGVSADLWFVSPAGLSLTEARSLSLADRLTLRADRNVDLYLDADSGEGWIAVSTGGAARLSASGAEAGGLRIDGASVAGAVTLQPGRHILKLGPGTGVKTLISESVSKLWVGVDPSGSVPQPVAPAGAHGEIPVLWEHRGEPPAHRTHGNLRVWGEPEPDIGRAETWINRLVGPPAGYGWHGSERAGWSEGVQGSVMMDLGAPTDIAAIELVRSRRARTEAGAFNPGEFEFDLVLSDDAFDTDRRVMTVTDAHYGIYHLENAHYTHTRRFPLITVPVHRTARYVRLTPRRVKEVVSPPADYYGTYRDGEISFMEIAVLRRERESRREARLMLTGLETGPGIVVESGAVLTALARDGAVCWHRTLDAMPAAPSRVADLDGDGRPEILAFTLAETLSSFDAATGECVLRFDLDSQPNTPAVATLSHSQLRPNAFAAWRSDSTGRREIAFFPHYAFGRIVTHPEPAYQPVEYKDTARSAKAAFEVPDVTGDGRPELALLGVYGNCYGILPSDAPLEEGSAGEYLARGGHTGYNSGNMELQLYWAGAVVRDASGQWMGTVAVNPGGIDFLKNPGFERVWSHMHHPENRCFTLADLDDDGTPEILVGREDGCVVAYGAADGRLAARVTLDGELRALAAAGSTVLAGTENGVSRLDRALRVTGFLPGPVEAIAVPGSADSALTAIVALSDGRVRALGSE